MKALRARVILLGDVHPLFRTGMRSMLQEVLAPAEVVEAGSRSELLVLLERGSFDLTIFDAVDARGGLDVPRWVA